MKPAFILLYIALALPAFPQTTPTELPKNCPASDSVLLPAEAESALTPKTFPSCASYRSYRGIGRPVDFAKARACAWRERLAQQANLDQNPNEPTAWIVGGSLILADVYFNGAGVKRDIPLAMRFACESDEGMVTLALPDIAKLKDTPRPHTPFEFCDYAARTMTMNFCQDYESQIGNDRRSRYFNSLKPSMTPEQQKAFEKLLTAQYAYVATHASEVDQSGTIRAIRTMGSQAILKDLFRMELVLFERKEFPALSDAQIKSADAVLARAYEIKLKELRNHKKEEIEMGAVTTENLSKVERAWEAYRDAWSAFATLRYPSAGAAIRAKITLDRYRLIKTIG